MRFFPRRVANWPRNRLRRFIFSFVSNASDEGLEASGIQKAADSQRKLPGKDNHACDSARAGAQNEEAQGQLAKQADKEESQLPGARKILKLGSTRQPRRLRALLFEAFIDLCLLCNFILLAAQHYKQGEGWDKAS
jgi:hypothetical protein